LKVIFSMAVLGPFRLFPGLTKSADGRSFTLYAFMWYFDAALFHYQRLVPPIDHQLPRLEFSVLWRTATAMTPPWLPLFSVGARLFTTVFPLNSITFLISELIFFLPFQ